MHGLRIRMIIVISASQRTTSSASYIQYILLRVGSGSTIVQQDNPWGQIDPLWHAMRYWSKIQPTVYRLVTRHRLGWVHKIQIRNTNAKNNAKNAAVQYKRIYRCDDEPLTIVLVTRHCLCWAHKIQIRNTKTKNNAEIQHSKCVFIDMMMSPWQGYLWQGIVLAGQKKYKYKIQKQK